MKRGKVLVFGFVLFIFVSVFFFVAGQSDSPTPASSVSPFPVLSTPGDLSPLDSEVNLQKDYVERLRNNFPVGFQESYSKDIPLGLSVFSLKRNEKISIVSEIVFKNQKASIVSDNDFLTPETIGNEFIKKYKFDLGLSGISLDPLSIFSNSYQLNYPSGQGGILYQQIVKNLLTGEDVSVYGGYVFLGTREGEDGVYLDYYKSNIFSTESLSKGPSLTAEQAIKIAKDTLSIVDLGYKYVDSNSIKSRLVAYPINGLTWAYVLRFPIHSFKSEQLEVVVVEPGIVVNYYNDLMSAKVSGAIYLRNPKEPQTDRLFANNYIWINGEQKQTDSEGEYNIEVGQVNLESRLEGQWAKVIDKQTDITISMKREGTSNYDIYWKDFDISFNQEQSNVFYHINVVHDFALQPHLNVKEMNFQMLGYVNHPRTCNAYYTDEEGAESINFFQRGDSCEATSLLSDVIYHEYGHGILQHTLDPKWANQNFPYWDETGNMHESFADYIACTINNDPCVGEGFKKNRACLRRCDTEDKYPNDYFPEPHSGAQILTGAWWDIRKKMVEKLGEVEGVRYTDALVAHSFRSRPTSFVEHVNSIIRTDDDNFNLDDGTPNIGILCPSFLNHGILSEFCAGHIDSPLAYLQSPKKDEEFDLEEKLIKITGTAWPSKGSSISRWILEYGKYNPKTKSAENWIKIKESTIPIKHELLETWDVSGVDAGQYILRLVVYDVNGDRAESFSIFKLYHLVKLNILSADFDPQNNLIVGVAVKERSQEGTILERFDKETGPCTLVPCYCTLGSLCSLKYHSFSDESDFILSISSVRSDIDFQNKYIFIKRYRESLDTLNFDLHDTREIVTNIDDIKGKWNMEISNTPGKIYVSTKPDLDLFYDDYVLFFPYVLYDQQNNRFLMIEDIISYPFEGDLSLLDAEMKNIKIHFSAPFNSHYQTLSIDSTPQSQERMFNLLSLQGRVHGAGRFQINEGDYDFYYLEKLDDMGLNYNFEGGSVLKFSDEPPRLFNPTVTWSNKYLGNSLDDIHIFKEPIKLNFLPLRSFPLREDLIYFFDRGGLPYKDDDLIATLEDSEGGVIGGLFPTMSKISVKYPDGNIETFSSVDSKDEDIIIFVPWLLSADKNVKESNVVEYAVIYIPGLIGVYDIAWGPFGKFNVEDRDVNMFKDGHTLVINQEFYYDGEKFQKVFLRGDSNADEKVDISDAVFILNYLFNGGTTPQCLDAADADDNGNLQITDAIKILSHLFTGGGAPPFPYPERGGDLTEDNLGC